MFGNVIYFDSKKISDYAAIARGSKNLRIEKMDISNDKGANLTLPIVGGDVKVTKSYEATIEENNLFDCDEFEHLLSGRDDYFDFTESSNFDITTLRRGYIVKFESTISIPEAFDLTQTIAQFKPLLISSISKDMPTDEQEAFKTLFSSAEIKIPLLSECKDCILCAKLESKCLKTEYAQLDDYETSDVTILARIVSPNMIDKSKEIFDPLKDFISLNRTMRRSMSNERPDGLQSIYLDEDYKNIEILAIYQ